MSVPVLERRWVATQRAQGFSVDDPWSNGVRQAQFVEAALQDTRTPTHVQSLRFAAIHAQLRKKEDEPHARGSVLNMLFETTLSHEEPRTPTPHDPPTAKPVPNRTKTTSHLNNVPTTTNPYANILWLPNRQEMRTTPLCADIHDTYQTWNANRKSKPVRSAPYPHPLRADARPLTPNQDAPTINNPAPPHQRE